MSRNVIPWLALGSEQLRTVLEIAEQYVLLAPTAILADDVRPSLISALAELIGSLKVSSAINRLME